jgi:hypothetical protein
MSPCVPPVQLLYANKNIVLKRPRSTNHGIEEGEKVWSKVIENTFDKMIEEWGGHPSTEGF